LQKIRQQKLKDWRKEAVEKFGKNAKKWKFKCARCGNVQSMEDFKGLVDDPNSVVHFSCIGRWKKGVGCDWTLGGLFQIHTLDVINEDGNSFPVFEFAEIEDKS
jgi:hypothetical protein